MLRRVGWGAVLPGVVGVVGCGAAKEAPVPASEPVPEEVLPVVWGSPPIEDSNPDPKVLEVSLVARPGRVKLGGHVVEMMTFNGYFPGPLIQARAGDQIIVHFKNELAEPTTIHWHGMRIPDSVDGSPRIQSPVKPGESFDYRFVAPEAGSFWYHPHVRAHDQIERGLYGPIVVRGKDDPKYDAERYVMLDDVWLDADGKIMPPFSGGFHESMHGREGNEQLTNGQISASVTAESKEGAVERWRIVNAANARTMQLSLKGARFRVIGTDGGLLVTPYETKNLQVAVGQRFDIEVSYDAPGKAELISDVNGVPKTALAVDVAPTGQAPREIAWPEVALPPSMEGRGATKAVNLTFEAVETPDGEHPVEWRINGQAHAHEPLFTFARGETVKMRLVNRAHPEHPFHLHGQFFEVVGGKEPGLKDTVLVPGSSTVEIVAYLDNPGRWMAHCHILEHAEEGMMSEILVTP